MYPSSPRRIALLAATLVASLLACVGTASAAAPSNDNFANAQTLVSGVAANGTTSEATIEIGEPGYSPSSTVWYRFDMPAGGVAEVTLCPAEGGYVSVMGFSGTALNNLVSSSDYPETGDCNEPYRLGVPAGGTAWLQVDGSSAFSIEATYHAAPDNDNFANAATLTGSSGSVPFDNTWATVEPGEVDDDYYDGQSLWYKWTAPADGLLYVSACSENNSDIEHKLTLYTGDALGWLNEIDYDYYGCPGDGGQLEEIAVSEGLEYRIRVNNYYVDEYYGAADLKYYFFGSVTNGNVADAIDLGNNIAVDTTGSNFGAAPEAESGESFDGNSRPGSVWYKWTAPRDGKFLVDLCSLPFDGNDFYLGIFTSSAGSTATAAQLQWLDPVSHSMDDGCSSISYYNGAGWSEISATAGTTYWIGVANYSESYTGGAFGLRVRLSEPTTDPEISGAPFIGKTLSVSSGEWDGLDPDEFSYQWLRCDTSTCDPVSGATNPNYELTMDDYEYYMRAVVTVGKEKYEATFEAGPTEQILIDDDDDGVANNFDECPSANNESPKTNGCPITDLAITSNPSISGTAAIGSTLTAVTGTAQNIDVVDPTTPVPSAGVMWKSCGSVTETGDCDLRGEGTTYTPTAADANRHIRARVTWSNGDTDKTVWSDAVGPVPAPPAIADGGLTIPGGKKLGTFKKAVKAKGRYVNKKVALTCVGAAPCVVTVALTTKIRKKTVKLGTLKFTIAGGKSAPLRAKFSKSGLKLLKKHKKLKTQLAISSPGLGGG